MLSSDCLPRLLPTHLLDLCLDLIVVLGRLQYRSTAAVGLFVSRGRLPALACGWHWPVLHPCRLSLQELVVHLNSPACRATHASCTATPMQTLGCKCVQDAACQAGCSNLAALHACLQPGTAAHLFAHVQSLLVRLVVGLLQGTQAMQGHSSVTLVLPLKQLTAAAVAAHPPHLSAAARSLQADKQLQDSRD